MKQTRLKNALEKFNLPIRYCKICFKKIQDNNVYNFVQNNGVLCQKCQDSFNPKFETFKIRGYKGLSIYEYDETIKKYLYQYKGCGDYEMFDTFLRPYSKELKMIYRGYVIVPIPSYHEHDIERGFNHVQSMFNFLGLEMMDALIKTMDIKQADQQKEKRKEIYKYMKVKENIDLEHKKILIVDDVLTTGSTIKAAIDLLRQFNPKDIKVLVMSKGKERSYM